jgi:uncharacterized protein YndB with AHSA1/START domain
VSTVEVAQRIAATPARVWDLIHDPTGMSGLTAECVEMEWVGSSSEPGVGARFRGRNHSGWRRWSTICTIVRYEPCSEIAWDVSFGPLAVARWSYSVEPGEEAGGVTIRERFDDHRGPALRTVGPIVRGTRDADGRNRSNMEATLARIKARAEA